MARLSLRWMVVAVLVTTVAARPQAEDLGGGPNLNYRVLAATEDGRTIAGLRIAPSGTGIFHWDQAAGFTLPSPQPVFTGNTLLMTADGREVYLEDGESGTVRWLPEVQSLEPVATLIGVPAVVTALNSDASRIAGHTEISALNRGFLWTPSGGLEDLGTLPGLNLRFNTASHDLSVLAGTATDAQFVTGRGIRWTEATGLVALDYPGATFTSIDAGSADGTQLCGSYRGPQTGPRGFHWTHASGFTDLGSLNGGVVVPTHMSADGVVITGIEVDDDGGVRPFRWSLSTGIETHPTLDSARPDGISSDGSTIIGTLFSPIDGRPCAFRWSGGDVRCLPSLGGGDSDAATIAPDGSLVIGSASRPNGAFHPCRWRLDQSIGTVYCGPASTNSSGLAARLTATGFNVASFGQLRLRASGLPVGSAAVLLGSTSPTIAMPVTGSSGSLCLAGGIGRFALPGPVQAANPLGQVEVVVDPAAMPSPSGPVAALYGETWYFQTWFRDLDPAPTSNFTDAVEIRIF